MNAYAITRELEKEICAFTDAPFCVAVSSCTDALELCLARLMQPGTKVFIPRRTYVSVPQVIRKQGGHPDFRGTWNGSCYALMPLPIWDCAKMFYKGMYKSCPGQYLCLSFHAAKVLGDTQGGAILTDNEAHYEWFKRARYDGRGEVPLKDDKHILPPEFCFHCYMSPDVSTRLLLRMQARTFTGGCQVPNLEEEYSDLSELECFK